MKKLLQLQIFALVFLLIINLNAVGQDKTEKTKRNLFCSLQSKITTIDGSLSLIAGADLGLVFDNKMLLGIEVNSSTNPPLIQGFEESTVYIFNAGLTMGYIFNPGEKLHPLLKLGACYGYLFLDNEYIVLYEINPEALFEFNTAKRIKYNIGIGYRTNNPIDLYANKYAYISGPELVFGVKWILN